MLREQNLRRMLAWGLPPALTVRAAFLALPMQGSYTEVRSLRWHAPHRNAKQPQVLLVCGCVHINAPTLQMPGSTVAVDRGLDTKACLEPQGTWISSRSGSSSSA